MNNLILAKWRIALSINIGVPEKLFEFYDNDK